MGEHFRLSQARVDLGPASLPLPASILDVVTAEEVTGPRHHRLRPQTAVFNFKIGGAACK